MTGLWHPPHRRTPALWEAARVVLVGAVVLVLAVVLAADPHRLGALCSALGSWWTGHWLLP